MDTLKQLTDLIRADGYTFVKAPDMRNLLVSCPRSSSHSAADAGDRQATENKERVSCPRSSPHSAADAGDQQAIESMELGSGSLSDWPEFAASWNDLGPDTYMADGGRYRKRRHAVFQVSGPNIVRQPAQPHYQSRDYNTLNGGIERWFEPVTDTVGSDASMTTILSFCHSLFNRLTPAPAWHVEVHQFRIEARQGQVGRPTPEGMHRDGVDHVLVLLINRRNIASGVTSVHDFAGKALGHFTLTEPFDAALVDDTRVMHGVTPVQPMTPDEPGFRDVLVVTFRRL